MHGAPPLSSSVVLALGGVPGNGFDLPHDTSQMILLAQSAAALPEVLRRRAYTVMLPFDWLRDVLPIFKPFRAPARLATGVLLCCAVLAAFAAANIHNWCRARFGAPASSTFILALAAMVFFEALACPYPIGPVDVHPFFHRMARDREFYAIVEAPLLVGADSHHRQTIHGKAMFVGNLARAPRHAFRLAATNALLRFLSPRPFQWDAREEAKLQKQTLPDGLAELRAIKTRYIVVVKRYAIKGRLRRYDTVLRKQLKLPMVFDDEELRVYRL